MKTMKQKQLLAALLLALSGVVVILLRTSVVFIGDDAYMTFRYAKNIVEGNGFVSNPGEYVLGTTTPLWTWLLAAASYVTGSDPTIVFRPILIFFDLLNLVLMFLLTSSRMRYPLRGAFAALALSLSYDCAYASVVGMEAGVFVSLLLLVVLLAETPARWARFLSALLAATSFMTRPEGALLCLALLGWRFYRTKRVPWLEGWTIACVGVPYLLWMYWYFGVIVPQSAIAKSVGYLRRPLHALRGLAVHLSFVFATPVFDDPRATLRWGVIAALVVLWGVGMYRAVRALPHCGVLLIFQLLFILLYAVTNPFLFEWYLVPLEPGYLLGVIWAMVAFFERSAERRVTHAAEIVAAVVVMLFYGSAFARYSLPRVSLTLAPFGPGHLIGPGVVRDPDDRFRVYTLGPEQRENLYITLAHFVSDREHGPYSVMAPEFGASSYYTKARIISTIGHLNPEMMKYLPPAPNEFGGQEGNGITRPMVEGLAPDYILALDSFISGALLGRQWFDERYQEVASFPSRVFSSKRLYLFERRDRASRHPTAERSG